VAQFVLTITSDSAEEIASFLSPPVARFDLTVERIPEEPEPQEEPPKRKGRPPKTESPATQSEPEASTETSTPTPDGSQPSEEVTLADVKTLINQAVKVKPAKAVVDALTAKCGTAAPGAMSPAQLAIAKTTLEGLLNE
jgi:hypothetical protein